ncbi:D-hexose-6-phosphate mutarotase [Xylophilus rhododendri]|uniref:Putative glucose-6-phosphate 1-epimerase n=1 Tax=Xylophilus rhododendri TaxID=2697032 RepID=A0A857J590_9BURK|nr:D-hexose-6-phosphate mutarotase [Xylophilus rhododendri]QHI98192.1 D-hexose-6-phosphate mutarotase [Xylophilus rhododendri]
MASSNITFHGQPAIELSLPEGDRAIVALHGAQVLSWTPAGGPERLYLSPEALFDGQAAIRGGVPVCWPQFNERGPLPKHGFVRNLAWSPVPEAGDDHTVVLALRDSEATRAMWPHAFNARIEVGLAPQSLTIGLMVENTGREAFAFTMALHTYLRIDDIDAVRLHGLGGLPYWDAVTDTHPAPLPSGAALAIQGQTDRVYEAAPAPLTLADGLGRLSIAQDPVYAQTTVWNPGAELCAKLAQMPADGYRQMLCVEAAVVDTPVRVAPGEVWAGAQKLSVVPA